MISSKQLSSRQLLSEGRIFAIPMKRGGYCFAVVCPGPDCAFFRYHGTQEQPPNDLLSKEVAFRVFVAKDAPRLGKWKAVGKIELIAPFSSFGVYLHRPVGSLQTYAMTNGKLEEISLDNAKSLELAATWFSNHIEDRLEDALAGRDSSYVVAMRRQHGVA